ncbi:MAG: 1-(5-phosphoribosyl)-5-[(5-phosphoribosylamino)methylideneamino]imidazole-4-carboxamide isomerase [Armatimonadota bacterium]|nr:1-(5-phosphoribosyl)-5-[(5-phosphoribosylamino)methylideneamino]imidazole-4-carboxamide isomerase [Armatimonadota bacterium]MDR7532855.1 1-(5-phosphoribosyl)-5-[(5-phosphoribosylamino)methylideneamino]imidazole-4-carboxamide isomerase [Armatimonadota bacterium]MDR7535141.1 1-(5-phosphoribosyl)-5-[(5-phosphoribosylamino)methylideneamino]imidazole-4-carboxamide isomerase [Armatimonadota bacterium]
MIVYAAIDLRGGRAVRLRQGDPAREDVFADDPVAVARRWAAEGAAWLHLVDLDGALAGAPRHVDAIGRICAAVPVPVQVGGGLRRLADVETVLAAGAARAILGTAALAGPLLRQAVRRFGEQIAVSLDVRRGAVAVCGWQAVTAFPVLEAARRVVADGAPRVIYTDVTRDGMLAGPDLGGLAALVRALPVPVILAGGVTTPDDVRAAGAAGAEGVIVGRALYEGRLRLAELLRLPGVR